MHQHPAQAPFGPNWAVLILPYIEQQNLFNLYNLALPNVANTPGVLQDLVKTYVCPSDPSSCPSPATTHSGRQFTRPAAFE